MVDFTRYQVAFFSMEVGIRNDIPTYAGGLGVLAGDSLRSASDLNLPIIGVTLLYRDGYFHQRIKNGEQVELGHKWDPAKHLTKLDDTITLDISGRELKVGCWYYPIKSKKNTNYVLFLDTDVEGNPDDLRMITRSLYQGDRKNRIAQEMVLGLGGVKMLEKLGCRIKKYHMNEGHSAFLTLALCRECTVGDVLEGVRKRCVFTTHTPVSAGHDTFDKGLIMDMVGAYIPDNAEVFKHDKLNMTELGLRYSGYINGVARRHMGSAREMFPDYPIEFITNGIHARFWTAKPMAAVFDEYLPGWSGDPFALRSALNIPKEDIWNAHEESKKALLKYVEQKTGVKLDMDKLTIGFARRFVEYKRPGLILSDIERLERIAKDKGLQIIYSGKAHPNDASGKRLLKQTIERIDEVAKRDNDIKVVFLEDYDMEIAGLMVAGCDLWLNNPRRPYEASGTSGMKAAINGTPHFSTLDGWWLEGHIEGVTGWCIGLHPMDPGFDEDEGPDDEAEDLYKKLNEVIMPMFYGNKDAWKLTVKRCIAINGSFFNTHRMMEEYVMEAYLDRNFLAGQWSK